MSDKPISPMRRRMIEDMTVRNFVEKTRNDYIRHVRTFTTFLGRAPDKAALHESCFWLAFIRRVKVMGRLQWGTQDRSSTVLWSTFERFYRNQSPAFRVMHGGW